jgi:hypothetical protein
MPSSKRVTYAIALLIVYTMSLTVLVPPHSDIDSAAGSGNVQVTSHADANNCKHIPISHAETCSLCSYFAGRALLSSSPFVAESAPQATISISFHHLPSYSLSLLTSFSRRGPPALHTIA